MVRACPSKSLGSRPAQTMSFVVRQGSYLDGHHHMNSFSSREFGPTRKTLPYQQITECKGSIGDECHSDTRSRVQIENHYIRVFEIIDHGVPRMQLHHPHLNQPQQSLQVIHPKSRSSTAFALFNLQLMHAVG